MLKRQLVEGKVYVRRDGKITGALEYSPTGIRAASPAPQDLQYYDPIHEWYYDAWGNTGIDNKDGMSGHPADLVGEFENGSGHAPAPGTAVAVKHDTGKAPYDILPLDLLEQTAIVFGKGAAKYGRENFRQGGGFEPHRPLGAALRHLVEAQRAIEANDHERMKDAEMGTPHIAHAICSLLILTDSLRQRGWKV